MTVLWLGDELAFVLEIFLVLVADVVGGVVVVWFRFVTRMVAGLFVRSVGLENREVDVGVEEEVRDRNLQPFPALRLDDDVGDLVALLVFYHIGDAADLATVRRPRLDRRRPEPTCEYPVRCRRDPTTLDVAYDGEPRVVGALRLVYVLVQLLCGERRPIGDNDYKVGFPLLVGFLEETQQRLGPWFELGNDGG